jgi:hypothetical protein
MVVSAEVDVVVTDFDPIVNKFGSKEPPSS